MNKSANGLPYSITSGDENDSLTHLRLLKRVVFLSSRIIELPLQNPRNIGLLCEWTCLRIEETSAHKTLLEKMSKL